MALPQPATVIAVGVLADGQAFKDYAAQATPLLEAAGGTVTGRHAARETVTGAETPGVVFTMRFEDIGRLRAALDSDAYRALLEVRARAFARLDLWIAPEGDDA